MSETVVQCIEVFSVVLGGPALYLYIKGKYTNYILALICTILTIIICIYRGIYAMATLNVYYSVVNVIGWVSWYKSDVHTTRAKNNTSSYIPYTYASTKQKIYTICCLTLSFFPIYCLSSLSEPPQTAFWDALACAISVVAIVLGARRKIDSWLLWILYDVICVYMFTLQGAPYATLQYVCYIPLGFWGWHKWEKKRVQLPTY